MTKKISIVSPCFNEQANLISCSKKYATYLTGALPTYDYEHIFVDNCSTDETRSLIRQVLRKTAMSKRFSMRAIMDLLGQHSICTYDEVMRSCRCCLMTDKTHQS